MYITVGFDSKNKMIATLDTPQKICAALTPCKSCISKQNNYLHAKKIMKIEFALDRVRTSSVNTPF